MAFVLSVKLANKPNNKEIKIFTGFYLYMYDCVKKALEENKEIIITNNNNNKIKHK